ncbi:MAG TPA: hypothetical protein VNO30_41935 [Kofleriaceae bacterium]|nr:hypothetical protein [Kofleriaceae bacterium]
MRLAPLALRQRWERYWYRAGGRYAAAAVRIALGVSILWMLWRLRGGQGGTPEAAPDELYRPIGILKLLPWRPGETTFAILWPVAWLSTLAMLVGAWSRGATAVSFVAGLAIASYEYSFLPTWSHDNNPQLLAHLAFLGARGGDAWSIDAWRRQRRGLATPEDHPYLWSVLLVQLTVALVMANAAFYKLHAGGAQLSWIFSDNLRNHVLARFDLKGLPRTELASWLIEEPARWKAAALLNVIAQLLPLAACFATRRPVLRAVLGGAFVTETVALDLVMDFPNYLWIPLAAAFVDWDRLVARLVARLGARARPAAAPRPIGAADAIAAQGPPSRAARGFLVAFLVADVAIAFWRWPRIDQKLSAYPLTAFPMFATIRAEPPYGEHRPYEFLETRFEVDADPAPGADVLAWADSHRRGWQLTNVRSPDALHQRLTAFAAELRAAFPAATVRAVRVSLVAIRAASYPAPAGLTRAPVATLAELTASGELRAMLGRVDGAGAAPSPRGLPPPQGLAVYDRGQRTELAGPPPRRAFVLARAAVPGLGERWFVVGTRR